MYTRHWCFTLNNPLIEDEAKLHEIAPSVDYLVYGLEKGENGTEHFQGYVCFPKKKRMTALKKIFPRAHFEGMKGSPQQASDYCKKDGEFSEFGILPGAQTENATKKRKADYALFINAAKRGAFQEIEDADPGMYVRHYRTMQQIRKDNPPDVPRLSEPTNLWYYGPPGTGKSHAAREDPNHYSHPPNKWWDGYQGQDVVVIDDLDHEQAKFFGHHLKIWGDIYPFQAEIKGGSMLIRPKKIIVTSNYSIDELFQDYMLCQAIKRRFTEKHFLIVYNKDT